MDGRELRGITITVAGQHGCGIQIRVSREWAVLAGQEMA